ncbi:MAG: hypothetical protein ACI8W3_000922, partial [Myxococcota bacterium]
VAGDQAQAGLILLYHDLCQPPIDLLCSTTLFSTTNTGNDGQK